MLKFLALSPSCKKLCGSPNSGRSVLDGKTRKSARKADAEWFVREGIVQSNPEKSSGRLNCLFFLTGPGIKAK